jgi:hypothetical protein
MKLRYRTSFELELRERHSHLLEAGLKVKSLNAEFVKKTECFIAQYPRPSMMDHWSLALAIQEQCPLLTGDKELRAAAKNEGVEVHGTVWVIDQLLNLKLIQLHKTKASFETMKDKGSRLPWADVDKLLNKWSIQLSRCEDSRLAPRSARPGGSSKLH